MALGPQRPGWEHLAVKGRRGSLASLPSAQASDLKAHHTRAYLCCPSAHKTNSCFIKLINFWKLGGHTWVVLGCSSHDNCPEDYSSLLVLLGKC